MKNFKIIAAVAIVSFFTSCDSDETIKTETIDLAGNAQINFDAKVGTADFGLITPFAIGGQNYQFDNLRYWISNIELVNVDNVAYQVPNSYFLMEETKAIDIQDGDFVYPATKREAIDITNIPSGSYTKIRFSVGVDAVHNDNMSIQDGELSQLNGMTNTSWMWNTSYIFTSLKGKNTGSNVVIEVETGANSKYRTIELTLPTAVVISALKTAKVNLKVDVAKIIEGINLVTTPVITSNSQTEMTTVADNYKNNVFTVTSVE